jgi:single-strand DNA-binding protein
MNDLNSIMVEGTIANDPMYRKTKKGNPVCNFLISSNRFYKSLDGLERETSFFDVEAWDDLADLCQKLGHKGRRCRVKGRIRQDRWNTQKGEPRTKVVIVAESVEFRPEKKGDENAI